MRFKKVYIEITNNCNLNCSFCIHNKRERKFMDIEDFKIILDKIKLYTEYIYLHVLGEPLMHPKINEFIEEASKYFKVNITTNGYFLKRIVNNKNIRQVNISLQAYDNKVSLEKYMESIINDAKELEKNNTIINYRLWALDKELKKKMQEILSKYYNKVNINEEAEFIWPSLDNDYYNEVGSCRGLIDHIGILVDGTIIPCCLDSEGVINLGNIYKDELDTVLSSNRVTKMIEGFKNNKKIEELCKKCNFYDRIHKAKKG